MYPNLKWVRLVPDQPGKGGWKTGFHTFQEKPVNDIRKATSYHVYHGRWTKDHDTKALAGITNDTTALLPASIHAYIYPSLTDPTAQPGVTILGHNFVGGTSNHYWDFTNAVSRSTHAGNSVPATFLNVAGRCFVADGAQEGMILDDRVPAIHAQPNQKLGIGAPTQPPTGITFSPGGTAYVHNLSPYINHPNPNNLLGTILSSDSDIFLAPMDSNWTAIYAGAAMAHGGPAANAVTSNVTPFTATGTISITTNTSLVTLAGATWPANFKYAGLAINFNGCSYVISTHGSSAGLPGGTDYDLDGGNLALSNVQLVIMGVYDGPSLSGVTYTITGCQVTITGNPNSTLQTVNTGQLGYSQITNSNLVQVGVLSRRAGGYYRNLGNISLGPAGGGTNDTVTDATMQIGQNTITSVSNPWVSTNVGNTIIMDLVDFGGRMLVTTIAGIVSSGVITIVGANNSGGFVTARAWWGNDFLGVSDAAMVFGSAHVTSVTAPWLVTDVGKRIMVEQAGSVLGEALYTTIISFVNSGEVVLNNTCVFAAGVTGRRAYWRSSTSNTYAGPIYAYAWYDPETGACSNVSPFYQLPKPTTVGLYSDFANITPIIPIDRGSISYPDGADGTSLPTSDGTRFSHILFFRTLSTPGSSTLYPIGSLMPYVGKVHPGSASTRGSWNPGIYSGWMGLPNNYTAGPPATGVAAPNYLWDCSSDSDLLLSGGFRAPQQTNSKPMALLRGGLQQPGKVAYQAYWDRRLWVTNTQEPDVVAFSCDEAQCPLGIPEESFPPTNRLRIPSVDGRVLGIRVFSEMLLITTERWAYTVVGNDESNYRLIRISTRMGGVGQYQMDEFSSDVEGVPSTVYFFAKDGAFYEWVPGGSVTNIAGPVQDVLKPQAATLALYQATRVHCMSIAGRRVVCVANPNFSFIHNGSDFLGPLMFDIENRTWTDTKLDDGTTFGYVASSLGVSFTSLYGLDPPVQELASIKMFTSGDITVRRWMEDNPTHAVEPAVLETFPMNFDGLKTLKQLCMVNLHCSGGNATCQVSVNETDFATVPMVAMGAYVDPLGSIYAPTGALPVDSATAEDLVVLTAQFNQPGGGQPGGNAPLGYRFIIRITGNEGTAQDIYAIDIGYIDFEEQGDGDV